MILGRRRRRLHWRAMIGPTNTVNSSHQSAPKKPCRGLGSIRGEFHADEERARRLNYHRRNQRLILLAQPKIASVAPTANRMSGNHTKRIASTMPTPGSSAPASAGWNSAAANNPVVGQPAVEEHPVRSAPFDDASENSAADQFTTAISLPKAEVRGFREDAGDSTRIPSAPTVEVRVSRADSVTLRISVPR